MTDNCIVIITPELDQKLIRPGWHYDGYMTVFLGLRVIIEQGVHWYDEVTVGCGCDSVNSFDGLDSPLLAVVGRVAYFADASFNQGRALAVLEHHDQDLGIVVADALLVREPHNSMILKVLQACCPSLAAARAFQLLKERRPETAHAIKVLAETDPAAALPLARELAAIDHVTYRSYGEAALQLIAPGTIARAWLSVEPNCIVEEVCDLFRVIVTEGDADARLKSLEELKEIATRAVYACALCCLTVEGAQSSTAALRIEALNELNVVEPRLAFYIACSLRLDPCQHVRDWANDIVHQLKNFYLH